MTENIITTTNNAELGEFGIAGLFGVDDPEVGLNVVDLGLIYHLGFDEAKKKLIVTMTLTTQFCPMGDQITGDVTNVLQDAFPDWTILIDLTFDPPWDQSMISPEGKDFLGQY